MKPILDATAGNRAFWRCKNPPHVVFMDKEIGLSRPPHIFAVWQHLPFRDDVFSLGFFDPPHEKFGKNSIHNDPRGWDTDRYVDGRKIGGTFWGSLPKHWQGAFHKAAKELCRVAARLCFKWNTSRMPVDRPLTLFKDYWIIVQDKIHHSNRRRGKTETHWVTMVRK